MKNEAHSYFAKLYNKVLDELFCARINYNCEKNFGDADSIADSKKKLNELSILSWKLKKLMRSADRGDIKFNKYTIRKRIIVEEEAQVYATKANDASEFAEQVFNYNFSENEKTEKDGGMQIVAVDYAD